MPSLLMLSMTHSPRAKLLVAAYVFAAATTPGAAQGRVARWGAKSIADPGGAWSTGTVRAAFGPLPLTAAWRHVDAREGFEVVFLQTGKAGYQLVGCTTAVEDGQAWVVSYEIVVDDAWRTRIAYVSGRSASGEHEVRLEADGAGHWRVSGVAVPQLDGCFDIDLESSSCTNTLPVHRLALSVGHGADAPAAYVRALGFDVERLDQRYVRIEDDGTRQQFDYTAPVFDYEGRLVYDASGLVLDYPGIAIRDI
jgi:uncharacterized protein